MDKTLELLYERYQSTYEKWRNAPDFTEEDVVARIDLWCDYTKARDAYENYRTVTLRKQKIAYIPVVYSVQ